MRTAFIALALCIASIAIAQPNTKSDSSKNRAKQDQRGTPKSPFVVEVVPSEDAKKEAADNANERREKLELDRNLVLFTGVLALIGVLQLVVFGVQARRLNQTVQAANAQAEDMKASIAEAARSATAMEEVAKATKRNTEILQPMLQKQMRAYISVDTGVPTCQEGNIRFAGAPVMLNTGLTPARNVRHKIKAAILDLTGYAEGEYKFEEPVDVRKADAVLSSRQSYVFNAIVEDLVPEEEVPAIMNGHKKRLFVWGTVTYEDIFGETWETNFCHNFVFYKEKNAEGREIVKFLAYYFRSHNNAT